MNAQRRTATANRGRVHADRASLARKLDGLYDAIADGLRTPGLKAKLEDLETPLAQLDRDMAAPEPSPVRLYPNLSERYRQKVTDLAAALTDMAIRSQALEAIRCLNDQVTVHHGPDGFILGLEGAIGALVGLAQDNKSPPGSGLDAGVLVGSVKVVAGAGFEPAAFRL